jgi:hypothetical protein
MLLASCGLGFGLHWHRERQHRQQLQKEADQRLLEDPEFKAALKDVDDYMDWLAS